MLTGTALAVGDLDSDGVPDVDDRCPLETGQEQHLGCNTAQLLRTVTHTPKAKRVRHKRYHPPKAPSYRQVVWMANLEQRRWGGPSLLNRIQCESGGYWAASNGQYQGLLQFGPIWWSMWPGTPRGVRFTTRERRTYPVLRIQVWSDGKRVRQQIGKRRQLLITKYKGKLARNSTPLDAHAAIRVGQRAVSGDGPTTGWSCGL